MGPSDWATWLLIIGLLNATKFSEVPPYFLVLLTLTLTNTFTIFRENMPTLAVKLAGVQFWLNINSTYEPKMTLLLQYWKNYDEFSNLVLISLQYENLYFCAIRDPPRSTPFNIPRFPISELLNLELDIF